MKFVLYTNSLSPHQLPLAREIAGRIGAENFRYVHTQALTDERRRLGWVEDVRDAWVLAATENPESARISVETCDILLSGVRDCDLFERRCKKGLMTLYMSERWFKPLPLGRGRLVVELPGRLRLLVPAFRDMARRMVRLINEEPSFCYLPIGVHARSDMTCLAARQEKMFLWGYFVAPSSLPAGQPRRRDESLRVLWVGRMIFWKHVETLIGAVRRLSWKGVPVTLTLVGSGAERERLQYRAKGLPVTFHESLPVAEIRSVMRVHDVYVLCSDESEGWGAVVNEALEEGMTVLGCRDAGACATLLPEERQFARGDAAGLAGLLQRAAAGDFPPEGIGDWSVVRGADRLLAFVKEIEGQAKAC